MTSFWHWWVTAITLGVIGGSWWILHRTRKMPGSIDPDETTGHTFDGIEEYNKPLPLWWLWMFYILIAAALAYLALYPGLGNYKGLLGWTSIKQLEAEQQVARAKYDPIFEKYASMGVDQLLKDPRAIGMGKRLFANNCALCHGTDAKGGHGFPNLTDDDWLYGGEFETIKATLRHGRAGQMPSWQKVLTDGEIREVVNYVMQISGNPHDAEAASNGSVVFAERCTICHGKDAKGGMDFGAPNLTDNIWLYRQRGNKLIEDLYFTLRNGRTGEMPKWDEIMGENKIHLTSAYVYSLSNR